MWLLPGRHGLGDWPLRLRATHTPRLTSVDCDKLWCWLIGTWFYRAFAKHAGLLRCASGLGVWRSCVGGESVCAFVCGTCDTGLHHQGCWFVWITNRYVAGVPQWMQVVMTLQRIMQGLVVSPLLNWNMVDLMDQGASHSSGLNCVGWSPCGWMAAAACSLGWQPTLLIKVVLLKGA